MSILHALLPDGFGNYPVAHRLYSVLHDAGFTDLGYRPNLIGVRAGDPWIDYLPSVSLSSRAAITARGLMTDEELDADVAACRAHLADPGTVVCSYALVQVWGRKPAV